MANTLKLEIITPQETTFSEEVDFVTLPGAEGEMGVYPEHVPLVTRVDHGEIAVKQGRDEFYLAVGEGFAKIDAGHVAILTDMAVKSDEIDEAAAEEARKQAEARLEEKLSDEEAATVQAALAKSLAQLKVKRRRHS